MGRMLYISGSMGLGHAIRDIAIAQQMQAINSQLEIVWLANGSAAQEIKRTGGVLHKRWQELADLNVIGRNVAKGYALDLSDWMAEAGPGLQRNVSLFSEIVNKDAYDLVIGDETYGIWFNFQDIKLKRPTPFVMIYDFVPEGYLSFGQRLHHLVRGTRSNGWARDLERLRTSTNHIVFIGELDDIPAGRYGFLLPSKKRFAQKHYTIVGHVLAFDPATMASKTELRERLGYGGDPLIICTVGGTGVGKPLLELCSRTYFHLIQTIPNLQMVLVCGPLLDANSIAPTKGITVKGYVPDLYEHYAASDLVITQGGGNTTIELTALKVPFIYFPLEDHFEQQIHVSQRIERHRAGTKLAFSSTDPESLADTVLQNIGKPVDSMGIDIEGARKAAEFLCSLL